MDEDSYVILLELVAPIIKKQDTQMRSAISVHERLSATLRYLATGRNYEDLKFSTIISPQSLYNIIPQTCSAIYDVLRDDYMKVRTIPTHNKIILEPPCILIKTYIKKINVTHYRGYSPK